MLRWMKRYQPVLVWIMAIATLSSMLMMGYARNASKIPSKDQSAPVLAVAGRTFTQTQVQQRALMLGSILPSNNMRRLWSFLFLDGWVSRWILETGLGPAILAHDPASIELLQAKWHQEAQWQGYRHPTLASCTYATIFSNVNPQAYRRWRTWQLDPSKETHTWLKDRIELLLSSRNPPPPALKEWMLMMEKDAVGAGKAQPDPNLSHETLQLFGYSSLEEWLGPRFAYLCVQAIVEGAEKARSLGYRVNHAEVESWINQRIAFLWQAYRKVDPDSSLEMFQYHLWMNLGVDRLFISELLSDLFLFQDLCHHDGRRLGIADPLLSRELAAFGAESIQVERYLVPSEFQVRSFHELLALQLYWHLVTGVAFNSLELPQTSYSLDLITAQSPELTGYQVALNLQRLTVNELKVRMGVKRWLTEQVQSPLWEALLEANPSLKKQYQERPDAKAATSELQELDQRMEFLLQLPLKILSTLDEATVKYWVQQQDPWLQEQLSKASQQSQELLLPVASLTPPIPGIVDIQALIRYLQEHTGPVGCYTQDGKCVYAWEMVEPPVHRLLTFREALSSGVLDGLMHHKVGSEKEGEVHVAFKPLYDQLLHSWQAEHPDQDLPLHLDLLVAYRFLPVLRSVREQVDKGEWLPMFLPWSIVHESFTIHREGAIPDEMQPCFDIDNGQWAQPSPYHCMRRLSSSPEHGKPLQHALALQEVLSRAINQESLEEWIQTLKWDERLLKSDES